MSTTESTQHARAVVDTRDMVTVHRFLRREFRLLPEAVERVADPLLCGLRGVGIAAGLTLGDVSLPQVRSLVPVAAEHRPDPSTRATYDRMFAEFPKLYRSQRRMFARLNR